MVYMIKIFVYTYLKIRNIFKGIRIGLTRLECFGKKVQDTSLGTTTCRACFAHVLHPKYGVAHGVSLTDPVKRS